MQIALHDGTKVWVRTRLDLCYVIQGDDASGVIKVGRSSNPNQRVSTLISGVPFKARLVAVMFDGTRRERDLKALMAPHKVQGEWFLPSQELQDYIDAARKENAVANKVDITDDYFRLHVIPAVEAHLNGRQPLFSAAGDLVYRVLRDGLPALQGRTEDFLTAIAGQATPELMAGYLPLPFDAPTPSIRLPASVVGA